MSPSSANPAPPLGGQRWTDTLFGGDSVLIRPLLPSDRVAEREFIEDLSPESRRFRFLGQVASPGEALIAQLTNVDFSHDAALAATVEENGRERIVGVGRYCAEWNNARCECAVTVAEDWRDRGLGTVLMQRLIELARQRGIRVMYSIDATENSEMSDLARHLGFRRRLDPDDASQCIHTLDLARA